MSKLVRNVKKKTKGKRPVNMDAMDKNVIARRLIMPTYPNELGTIALIPGDWSSDITRKLANFSTRGNQTIKVRQSYNAGPLIQIANAINNGTITFTAGATQNFASLAAAFDQYRITVAECRFTPQSTVSVLSAGLGSTITNPRLYTCLDYDDTAGLTVATIEQYDSCVITPPSCGVSRVLRPRIAMAAYSGTFTSYANVDSDIWIDVASSAVIYYGVKYVVEPGQTGQTALQAYDVDVTLFMEFRALR
jgi:hypothetical protein